MRPKKEIKDDLEKQLTLEPSEVDAEKLERGLAEGEKVLSKVLIRQVKARLAVVKAAQAATSLHKAEIELQRITTLAPLAVDVAQLEKTLDIVTHCSTLAELSAGSREVKPALVRQGESKLREAKEAHGEVDRLVNAPDLALDVEALHAKLVEAQATTTAEMGIIAKLRKRIAEGKAALPRLEALSKAHPLKADCAEIRRVVELPPEERTLLSDDLYARLEAKLHEAEKAQADARAARLAAAQLALERAMAPTPLSADEGDIREAVEEAQAAGVDAELISAANEKLQAAARRGAAASELEMQLDMFDAAPRAADGVSAAWLEAASAGVAATELLAVQNKLREAERSKANIVTSRLAWTTDNSVATLHTEALQTAIDEATACGSEVPADVLSKAQAKLRSLQEQCSAKDDAALKAIVASEPGASPMADKALKRANTGGVDHRLLARVEARMKLGAYETSVQAVQAGNKALAERAEKELEELEKVASKAAEDAEKAAKQLPGLKAALEADVEAAATAVKAAIAADATVLQKEKELLAEEDATPLPEVAESTAEAWDAATKTRAAAAAAETKAQQAWKELQIATLEAEAAQRVSAHEERLARWLRQEAKAAREAYERHVKDHGKLSTAPLPPKQKPIERPKPTPPPSGGGLFGCCGAGSEPPVVEMDNVRPPPAPAPAPEAVLAEAQNELVDPLAWAPLKMSLSASRLDLLLNLTASGAYKNEKVCRIIAKEMCMLDTEAASQFVDTLTSSSLDRELADMSDNQEAVLRELSDAKKRKSLFRKAAPPQLVLSDFDISDEDKGRVAQIFIGQLAVTLSDKATLLKYLKRIQSDERITFTDTLRGLLEYHHTVTVAAQVKAAEAAAKVVAKATAEAQKSVVAANVAAGAAASSTSAVADSTVDGEADAAAGTDAAAQPEGAAAPSAEAAPPGLTPLPPPPSFSSTASTDAIPTTPKSGAPGAAAPSTEAAATIFEAAEDCADLEEWNSEAPAPSPEAGAPSPEAAEPSAEAATPSAEAAAPSAEAPAPAADADAASAAAAAPSVEAPAPSTEAAGSSGDAAGPSGAPASDADAAAPCPSPEPSVPGLAKMPSPAVDVYSATSERPTSTPVLPLGEQAPPIAEEEEEEEEEKPPATPDAEALVAEPEVFMCFEIILANSMLSEAKFKKLLAVWRADDDAVSPPTALAETAIHFVSELARTSDAYAQRRESKSLTEDDTVRERTILGFARLFADDPHGPLLTGFQNLVPAVFDVYLTKGSQLRAHLVKLLEARRFDKAVLQNVAEEDPIARQKFFWSAAGMKLFSGHEDVYDEQKLKALLDDAMKQQPLILVAFLDQTCSDSWAGLSRAGGIDVVIRAGMRALLSYWSAFQALRLEREQELAAEPSLLSHEVSTRRRPPQLAKGVLQAVDKILYESDRRPSISKLALDMWKEDLPASTSLLAHFADDFKLYKLVPPDNAPADAAPDDGENGKSLSREDSVAFALATLFVKEPATFTAFPKLVPEVFTTRFKLGSEPRNRLNKLLNFDPSLQYLLSKNDDLVTALFFWHHKVLPLFHKGYVDAHYKSLNAASLNINGEELHLYSAFLNFLLRINERVGGGDPNEIAGRTKEVLDQFEREPKQQQFLLSIFHKLDARSKEKPEEFDVIKLTMLTDVASNGVYTMSSVKGMALCEKAMTTLLQSYIEKREPAEWSELFKEAAKVAYMLKYMFRESLPLCKSKFLDFVNVKDNFKKMPHATETQELLKKLVNDTLTTYGTVGIFDPKALAELDFLNQPEELVSLVAESARRPSRQNKQDMVLLTEITAKWMEYMVDRNFPPLTPHHTQAFVVLMMSRFYKNIQESAEARANAKTRAFKKKYAPKAFVAQMSTGEGKSIVIAMLAIFMVRLYDVKVHVLENNEGLLLRDYATNKPFYDKFEIKAATDLFDEEAKISYCLKKDINRYFFRKTVAGELDKALEKTVIIVDEVDDLVVNEKPNSHYVKQDVQRSPELAKAFVALQQGQRRPDDVEPSSWGQAERIVRQANQKKLGDHYRIIEVDGKRKAVMLDATGHVPKVPLTSGWLQFVNFRECGINPISESDFACMCTPYLFNKYQGIFGLTGSVGGKAELNYLTKTYGAIKFDVPRFLDTCTGDARKQVINHGVEIHDDADKQLARVLELAKNHYRDVPVLIIAASLHELSKILDLIRESGDFPVEEVQRLSEFDEKGRSLRDRWQTIIDDATKRLGGPEDNRCRVTVTDRFGGRGHDYQVMDSVANERGGMLVIATSVPDEREWTQWKGRTARQDRPGQFAVVLNKKSPMFTDTGRENLLFRLKRTPTDDQKIEVLLDIADDGIGAKLKEFESQQATGEKLNELTEKYYRMYPRAFEEPWPNEKYMATDVKLRVLLHDLADQPPDVIRTAAQEMLQISLST